MAKKKDKKDKKAKGGTDNADAGVDGSGGAPKAKGGLVMSLITAAALGGVSFATVSMLPERAQIIEAAPVHTASHDQKIAPLVPAIEDIYFVEMEPLTISLGEKSRLLKIAITLEATTDEIDAHDPQIRDAFTGYLRALKIDQIEDPSYMAHMRAQLVRRAQLIKGSDAIHGVLITEFLLR